MVWFDVYSNKINVAIKQNALIGFYFIAGIILSYCTRMKPRFQDWKIAKRLIA